MAAALADGVWLVDGDADEDEVDDDDDDDDDDEDEYGDDAFDNDGDVVVVVAVVGAWPLVLLLLLAVAVVSDWSGAGEAATSVVGMRGSSRSRMIMGVRGIVATTAPDAWIEVAVGVVSPPPPP